MLSLSPLLQNTNTNLVYSAHQQRQWGMLYALNSITVCVTRQQQPHAQPSYLFIWLFAYYLFPLSVARCRCMPYILSVDGHGRHTGWNGLLFYYSTNISTSSDSTWNRFHTESFHSLCSRAQNGPHTPAAPKRRKKLNWRIHLVRSTMYVCARCGNRKNKYIRNESRNNVQHSAIEAF